MERFSSTAKVTWSFSATRATELSLTRSRRESAVDDKRQNRRHCRGDDRQSQPTRAGRGRHVLKTDLLLHRRVASVELVDVGRGVGLSAGKLGDPLQHGIVNRDWHTLI